MKLFSDFKGRRLYQDGPNARLKGHLRLAKWLRIIVPLIMVLIALGLEGFEEITTSHSTEVTGPHQGFLLEIFIHGFISPTIVALTLHFIVKVMEQLEKLRDSEKELRLQVESLSDARRDLLAETVRVQEAERQRIARDLHDGIGQPLTSFLMTSMPLSGEIDPGTQAHVRQAAKDTLDSIRQLILNLRPALLDTKGLLPALKKCAEETLNQAGITVEVTAVGQPYPLPEEIQTALFRIGQEAMSNIRHHASACQADVRLEYHPAETRLIISDNGNGFEMGNRVGNGGLLGLGLLSMKERSEQVGGQLLIDSRVGRGTNITAVLPQLHDTEQHI